MVSICAFTTQMHTHAHEHEKEHWGRFGFKVELCLFPFQAEWSPIISKLCFSFCEFSYLYSLLEALSLSVH